MKKTAPKKKTSTKKTVRVPKVKITDESVIDGTMIHCINHSVNTSPYWGGHVCKSTMETDGKLTRWVCAACVAYVANPPENKSQKAVDPATGEKRGRGRPRKHPVKEIVIVTDENGQPVKRGRGRPKGAVNKVQKQKPIKIGNGKRGRPKGSKNKSTRTLTTKYNPTVSYINYKSQSN